MPVLTAIAIYESLGKRARKKGNTMARTPKRNPRTGRFERSGSRRRSRRRR